MFSSRKVRGVVVSGVAIVAALTLTAGQSAAESGCFTFSGRYSEHAVTSPDCKSPVGLCIEAWHSHRQECGSVYQHVGRVHRRSPDHRRWHGQTRWSAGVYPSQRYVHRSGRRDLGLRRLSVPAVTTVAEGC